MVSPLNSDSVQMEPNGPVRVHLVPFVRCQSYELVWVKLDLLPEYLGQDFGRHFQKSSRSKWVNPFRTVWATVAQEVEQVVQ